MTSANLPLEDWLLKDHGANKFPQNVDYGSRYKTIKKWMTDNAFNHIGVGLTADDGNIYTSHGPDHFDKVIQYAGCLLGLNIEGKGEVKSLSPYEVYVLLIAILLHDSGNLFGRRNHEKRANFIFSKMGELAGNPFERRMIAEIAKAHGGLNINGDKDTIGLLAKSRNIEGHSIRPKLIAALVRFADEICEDHTRAAPLLLEAKKIPEENIIFHKYAEAIQTVCVDDQDESIELTFDILISDLKKQFLIEKSTDGEKSDYLANMIIDRLVKMDQERRYCMRFMPEVVSITKIKAFINVVDDDRVEVIRTEPPFILEDSGYPSISLKEKIMKDHPSWSGKSLETWAIKQEAKSA